MGDPDLYEVTFDCPLSVVRMLGELAILDGKDQEQIDAYIVKAIKTEFNRTSAPAKKTAKKAEAKEGKE